MLQLRWLSCNRVTIVLQVASQQFEFGDLWQLGRLLMAFHSDTKSSRAYSCILSLLLTVSSLSSPRFHYTAPVSTTAHISPMRTEPHHPRTSIICQCASFLMFSVSESTLMANRKWLKADTWWRPTSTAKGSLVPAAHLTTVSHWWYMPLTSMMYLSSLSRMHQYSSSLRALSYVCFFQINEHAV